MSGLIEIFFWISLGIELVFTSWYFITINRYKKGWDSIVTLSSAKSNVFVSVVVAARNEEATIEKCLRALLHQNYPKELFEIIVVNDHSDDSTLEKLKSYSSSNLKIVSQREGENGKRSAINTAVQMAKGEWILCTDADCWLGPNWIQTMIDGYDSNSVKLLLGPVQFKSASNSLLTLFQEMDFMTMLGIAGGSASNGKAHVCNGANMGYLRDVFIEVQPFDKLNQNTAGDDMEILEAIQSRYPESVQFVKSPEAMVYTEPKYSYASFFKQRIRWASTGGASNDSTIKNTLIGVLAYNFITVLLVLASIFSSDFRMLLVIHLFLKLTIDWHFLRSVFSFFRAQSYLGYLPIMQVFHILYILIVGIGSQLLSFEWKGRKIKA